MAITMEEVLEAVVGSDTHNEMIRRIKIVAGVIASCLKYWYCEDRVKGQSRSREFSENDGGRSTLCVDTTGPMPQLVYTSGNDSVILNHSRQIPMHLVVSIYEKLPAIATFALQEAFVPEPSRLDERFHELRRISQEWMGRI